MEYTYEGIVRHSFGFLNPNHASALFTMLIPLIWGLRRIFRSKLAFCCILIPETALYLALIATMSRTGMASVILGVAIFFYLTHKHWGVKLDRRSLILFSLIVTVAFTVLLSAGMLKRHYSWISSPPDDSMLNRLILWQGGLQIIADNPSGVGIGLSGKMFTEFYQADGARLVFRTMVNSFLTFMVEQGVFLSFFLSVPLFFSFASSFISLRCKMPERKKFIIISLMTSCFCAVLSGIFSTCFDFSAVTGCFSGMEKLNSFLLTFLLLAVLVSFGMLAYLPFRHLKPLQLKFSLLVSIALSTVLVLGAFLTGNLLNSSRKDSCIVSEMNGLKMVTVGMKNKHDGRMLVLVEGINLGKRGIIGFIRGKYEGYSIDFPMSPLKNPENLFKSYDKVVLCGANAVLASSETKTRFVLYEPSAYVVADIGRIDKVWLNQFDEYGCNRKWEKAFSEHRDRIQYLP